MKQVASFQAVYYVNPNELKLGPLAIAPTFYELSKEKYRCDWSDTGRGSFFEFVSPAPNLENNQPPKSFSLFGKDGKEIKFSMLTKEIFNNSLKEKVFNSEKLKDFSDDELQKYYLQHFSFAGLI